jgi:hypothetical protein
MFPANLSGRAWAAISGCVVAVGCWTLGDYFKYTCGEIGTPRAICWAVAVLLVPVSVGIAIPWRKHPFLCTCLTLLLLVLALVGIFVSVLNEEAAHACGSF